MVSVACSALKRNPFELMERKVITNNSLGFFRDQLETFLNGGWNLIVGSLVVTDNRQFAIVERNKPAFVPTALPNPPAPPVTTFQFRDDSKPLSPQEVKSYVAAIEWCKRKFNLQTEKIAAIKALRERFPGLGLAEAKAAIENHAKAIEMAQKQKKILQYAY